VDIKTVEFWWPVGMPTCKSLGQGLWEVRSSLTDGKIGRVIFSSRDGDMYLLHGFIKKSQKTPKADLDAAMSRKRDLET
jgi:phage-related protein